MKRWLKRIGLGLLVVLGVALCGAGIFAYTQVAAYNASMEKVYDIKPLNLVHSTDPAVIARGDHLAHSIAGCALCHGPDLSGGYGTDGGPIGKDAPPNITNILPAYSDGELARLIRHGLKKDGRTVRFMTVNDFSWLPDSDVIALMSYLRTKPRVAKTTGSTEIKLLGKILDRQNMIPIDTARLVDHEHAGQGMAPSPTVEYGRLLGKSCRGCHGEHMSGGPIPGTPPDFPVPLNLTLHETGLKGWTLADLKQVAVSGKRKDGRKLDKFMPVQMIANFDEVESQALWAYLTSLEPRAFGER